MILDEGQQRMVAELSQHPGWSVLHAIAKDKMDREFQRLASELMQTGEIPTDKFGLDYRRGFFAGMKFLLRKPLWEAADLEKALNERGVE